MVTRHDADTAAHTCLAALIGKIPSPDISSTATSAVSLLSAAGVVGAGVVVTAAVVTGAAVVLGTVVVATAIVVAGAAVAATGLGVALTGVAVVATAGRDKGYAVEWPSPGRLWAHQVQQASSTGWARYLWCVTSAKIVRSAGQAQACTHLQQGQL